MKKLFILLLLVAGLVGLAVAAETVSTETVTVTTQKRTWRIQVYSDYGTDYRAEFLREEIKTLPDNTVLARNQAATVSRSLTAIASQSVTLTNGKHVTAAELAEALSRFGDMLAAEDAAAAPPGE